MNLRLTHALREEEISKFKVVYTTKEFSIAEYRYSKGRSIASFTHAHDGYEFVIPLNTIPLLRYENASYIGEVGYCYPVMPYAEHGIEFELESDLISISIDKEYLRQVMEELGYKEFSFYSRFHVEKVLMGLIKEFLVTFKHRLIRPIVEQLIDDGLRDNIDNRKPERGYFKNIKDSIRYMLDHYQEQDLTIKKIADQSHYSYTYFTKAFKQFMHDTPINHLNKLRLSKAKELMRDHNLSLQDIASRVGFASQSTFTESFKRVIGYLPKDYRNKYL